MDTTIFPPVPIVDDNIVSEATVYSAMKTQQMHDAQAATIANLATAQAQITNDDTTAITTSNQVLSFLVPVPSTNLEIMTLDATADTITFLSNASYSFLSAINFSSSIGAERTITFEIYDTTGGVVLTTETIILDTASGQNVEGTTATLLTVGKNGVPSAPLTVGIRVRASGTGYTITGFRSILASSSSYDVTVGRATKLVTTNYTAVASDGTIRVNATTAPVSITLPETNIGYTLTIKKVDASLNAVTIVGVVDGVTNPTILVQYQSRTIQYNGTSWDILY